MKASTIFITFLFTISTAWASKSFDARHWQTSNGTEVVFYQAMEVPMVNITFAFAAGSAYDGEAQGLSALTTNLLNQGNAGVNASTLAEKLADTGAQYEADTGRDMIVLNLKTLSDPKALQPAVNLFSTIISHPDFPEDSFKIEKNQQMMAIAQGEDTPEEVANLTFFKALYQKHPYAHPINGTKESVEKLKIEQVKNFYRQFFVSKNAILVIVGAMNEQDAKQLSEQLTRNLSPGVKADPVPKAFPLTEEMNIGIKFPSNQTVVRLGQVGIDHHNKNYFPLMVGNYTLGGGLLVSRLAHEVREKRGLTYGVNSEFAPMTGLGPFVIGLATKNNQAETAIKVTRDILESFIKLGPTAEELNAAKQYLTGSFPLSLASNRSIANMLLRMAFYDLPDNYLDTYLDNINKVSADEIKAAFQELIKPNAMLQVNVGEM